MEPALYPTVLTAATSRVLDLAGLLNQVRVAGGSQTLG